MVQAVAPAAQVQPAAVQPTPVQPLNANQSRSGDLGSDDAERRFVAANRPTCMNWAAFLNLRSVAILPLWY